DDHRSQGELDRTRVAGALHERPPGEREDAVSNEERELREKCLGVAQAEDFLHSGDQGVDQIRNKAPGEEQRRHRNERDERSAIRRGHGLSRTSGRFSWTKWISDRQASALACIRLRDTRAHTHTVQPPARFVLERRLWTREATSALRLIVRVHR